VILYIDSQISLLWVLSANKLIAAFKRFGVDFPIIISFRSLYCAV